MSLLEFRPTRERGSLRSRCRVLQEALNTKASQVTKIVGYYWYAASFSFHGFIYDGTTYTTLDVPGASYTYAYGIDGGNIVGRHTLYIDGRYHDFIATIP